MVEELRSFDPNDQINKCGHQVAKTEPTEKSGGLSPRPDARRQLIKRLEALLAKQVTQMELGTMDQTPDKEIALLGTLARTLEKLIELDEKQGQNTQKQATSNEMQRLRKRLSARIKTLGLD